MTTYICVCGHNEDEHDGTGECGAMIFDDFAQADAKCACVAYEEDEDAE